MKRRKNSQLRLSLALSVAVFVLLFVLRAQPWKKLVPQEPSLNKQDIAEALVAQPDAVEKFPNEMTLFLNGKPERVIVQYAFDPGLQEAMERSFKSYRPDYGAFVALDTATGRVLSMISYADRGDLPGNLALRATFPSASIFKVVTAAAAIAERNFTAQTVIPFTGSNHTLYKKNILQTRTTRWTRYMTLKDAFALSVNPVFGKIGAYTLGADELVKYADRFGFNRDIPSDVPMQQGKAVIQDDAFSLAETASGFTRENTMSPLQGALIAAAIANQGVMMEPYVVESVHVTDGSEIYRAQPTSSLRSVAPETAREIQSLMQATVTKGTSRGAFRRFFRGEFERINVGGKTGSLTGTDPPGKYDWFVGYAQGGGTSIAIAALTVNGKNWKVKSSYLARLAIEQYFKGKLTETAQVASRRNKNGKRR